MLQIFSRFISRFACYRQPIVLSGAFGMVLQNFDLDLRDVVIFAVLAWLFIRYTWTMTALTLLAAGGALLVLLPLDIYYSLLPLALLGIGLGMLIHHYQQRSLALQREARTPRTYTQKQDEFHL